MQRFQRDQHLSGRTVGIGDDILLGIAKDRVGVHFGYDQRYVGVIAVMRAVIDHDTTGFGRSGRIFFGRLGANSKQRDIPTGKVEGVQVLGLHGFFAKAAFGAKGFAAGKDC